MIELRTFGALDLRAADGRELRPIIAQPKRLALLVYLATATPGPFHRRDALLGMFWPDTDPARARAALSRAVHYLRSFLGEGVLVSRGDEELGLEPGSISCDAVHFRSALHRADLEAALELYRGDFLEGFFLDGVQEFEHWLDTTRDALRDQAAEAARKLSAVAETKANADLALTWARRALALAPYDEGDMRRVVMLLERTGDRAGAVDVYQRFAKRLSDDLELAPSQESHALITSITQSGDDAIPIIVTPPMASSVPPARNNRRILVAATVGALLLSAAVLRTALSERDADRDAPASSRSIAVLPFANLSGDSANRFFADGMTDEMIGSLSEVSTLRVAARTSSFAYRNRELPVQQIARELNVATVLEGSVRREQNRLRITVQLVDGVRGYSMWSKTYDRKLSDVFELQDEISRDVVNALKIRLVGGREPARALTTDVETYDLYLWGRYHWNERSHESLRRALAYFERAAARDPNYAPAFTGLADTYNLLVVYDQPASEIMPKAKAAAERALALDSTDSEAHAARAYIATWYDWEWPKAERHFKRALELNPNNATARHWYSIYLAATGHTRESVQEMDKACELDPASLFLRGAMGVRLYMARDYARAAEQLERVFAVEPQYQPGLPWRALTYIRLKRAQEAVTQLEKARAFSNDNAAALGGLAIAYAAVNRRDDALAIIHGLEERAPREHFPASWIARSYAALGEHERALQWLERSYDRRDGWLTFIAIDPSFDPLRGNPRFRAVLERMRLK